MTRFVLDCSVTMAWCFEDESDKYADEVLDAFQHSHAVVPSLWQLEVANVLLMAEKRKRITRAQSDQFLGFLTQLPIAVEERAASETTDRVLSVARDFNLTAYDAAYFVLALKEGIPIATKDRGLRAAQRKSGVVLFSR